MNAEQIEHNFKHHPPSGDRGQRHELVRAELKVAAHRLNALLPDGREKSTAMTKLEEAMFWANAAIARTKEATGAASCADGATCG